MTCIGSGNWTCVCTPGNCGSCPIIIDTANQGFHLTDWKDGVRFNFFPDWGAPEQLSWTDPRYANGWLVLPNADGMVVNGTQLFGNITPQPPSDNPNRFLALAVYDLPENGGNGDGFIDSGDSVFTKLRVWIDSNHDGISQPDELKTLAELAIYRIDLKYQTIEWTDPLGNLFHYKGALLDDGDKDTIYDVFLLNGPTK
jgi:hypothetical protein